MFISIDFLLVIISVKYHWKRGALKIFMNIEDGYFYEQS